MALTTEIIGEVCVCRISGRLDAEAADAFRKELHMVGEEVAGPVVFSFQEVGFIGSACLGALIGCRTKLGKDRPVALCDLSVPIHKMFKFAALDQLFLAAPTVADAISLVKRG